jgi:O-6-methylguanine DNA methyltransferase
MKEQLISAVLPPLPIVGTLKLTSRDGKSLFSIEVVKAQDSKDLDPFFQECFEQLSQFLHGRAKKIDIKLDYSALTPFQKEVLRAMKSIPFGKTSTYKGLALKMNSKAYQAIGSACGRNPWMLIYPCHRVLGTSDIGGFAHGIEMKKKLLKLEGVI